jgi:muconate cycloisomerase
MAAISSFEIFKVDLPFKIKFKHAAAERKFSNSVFLKAVTIDGTVGFGECLPRPYVTGETQDSCWKLLTQNILPKVIGKEFESYAEVHDFLDECDGTAPPDWVDPSEKQSSAWCALDLALLDCFGKLFKKHVIPHEQLILNPSLRYSGVASADKGWKFTKTALKFRLYGLHQVKLKVDDQVDIKAAKKLKKILGPKGDVRVDANMGWTIDQALEKMKAFGAIGVTSFEQPIPVEDVEGLIRLVKETGLHVMADESLNTRASLDFLIEQKACTALNVRISKCGGLIAAKNRCKQGREAGMMLQAGCQVGESSILSAAHLHLIRSEEAIKYAEGCYGLNLLAVDPAKPLLQFGYKGRPPKLPDTHGLGVTIEEEILLKYASKRASI